MLSFLNIRRKQVGATADIRYALYVLIPETSSCTDLSSTDFEKFE
jgi:hypothetical protein